MAPGLLEQQEQQRFGNDLSGGLVGSPGPTYNDSRSQKTATRDDGNAMCCLHYTRFSGVGMGDAG
jgi:hypothetical protein